MPASANLSDVLPSWHDFYLLAGTVSATLMGLLFVAMSIHWDVVLDDAKTHLHAIALEAFGSFLVVAFLSLMMLTPSGGARPLGLGLVVLGVIRMMIGVRHSKQIWLSQDEAFSKTERTYRAILVPAAFAFLVSAGLLFFLRRIDVGLAVLTLAIFVLLALGARASWDLLVRVGRLKMRRISESRSSAPRG